MKTPWSAAGLKEPTSAPRVAWFQSRDLCAPRFSVCGIDPGRYNQTGLAMYELPNMVFAWVLLLLRPRRDSNSMTDTEVEALRTENAQLRAQLEKRTPDHR